METIGKIRRRGLRDGESISGLARSLQLSRNTVRKYLKDGVEPVYKRKPQPGPQLGPWCGRLDVDLSRFRSGLLRAILAIKETEYGSYT